MSQPSPDDQKQRVRAAFDRLAGQYDGLRFTRICAERLLELAGLGEGQRVLDVATGTGLVAGTAAQVMGPDGFVVGVDLSAPMLEVARAKFAGAANLEFRLGDAERLELPDADFDVVLCASSLFFVPDMLGALREAWRVLRPGGRVGFSSFGASFMRPLHDTWEACLARHGVAPGPLPTLRLADPNTSRALLESALFEAVEVTVESRGYAHETADSRWTEIVLGLEGLPLGPMAPEARERVRLEHLAELRAAGPLWLDLPAQFAFGRKPGAA